MQTVDRQALDHIAHGDNESIRPSDRDDRIENPVEITLLGRSRRIGFVEKLLNDIGKIRRQHLAHLRAGVFDRNGPADLRQLVKRNLIPVVQIRFLLLDELQLLGGIVDQRTKLRHFGFAQSIVENLVHLLPDHARSVLQHVAESLVFTVKVRKEMLGTFGKVQNSLQVDDFSRSVGNGREFLRKQIEEFQIGRRICLVHRYTHCNKHFGQLYISMYHHPRSQHRKGRLFAACGCVCNAILPYIPSSEGLGATFPKRSTKVYHCDIFY